MSFRFHRFCLLVRPSMSIYQLIWVSLIWFAPGPPSTSTRRSLASMLIFLSYFPKSCRFRTFLPFSPTQTFAEIWPPWIASREVLKKAKVVPCPPLDGVSDAFSSISNESNVLVFTGVTELIAAMEWAGTVMDPLIQSLHYLGLSCVTSLRLVSIYETEVFSWVTNPHSLLIFPSCCFQNVWNILSVWTCAFLLHLGRICKYFRSLRIQVPGFQLIIYLHQLTVQSATICQNHNWETPPPTSVLNFSSLGPTVQNT